MKINITKEVLKSQAAVMRAFLKVNGQELTQSSAYILLSKIYGFKDWNTLSAALKNEVNE